MRSKLGRNDPCPCNSGKKYKKCHGSPEILEAEHAAVFGRAEALHGLSRSRLESREFQRREQQGLGRPIMSTQVAGHRIIAVGGRLHASKDWNNFHDFLRDYPKIILGVDWWQEEMLKPAEKRHRIATWFQRAAEQAAALPAERGGQTGIPATGAMSAYMRLAYDLYALQHSEHVEQLLIDRIKSPLGFPGAIYEVRVAASLLRAGFTLELEDETDRRTTHVEFVATHVFTGAKFSVEAKRREGHKLKFNRLLHSALTKHAEHPRIVFIDTNDSRLEFNQFEKLPIPLAQARKQLKLFAADPGTASLPPAYVITTLAPEEHHLDAVNVPFSFQLLGFRIADLQPGLKTLEEQVQIQRRHSPVFELLESMTKHRVIPLSFDGEADAFAINRPTNQLQIGERYVVPGPDGVDVEAVLEGGVVMSDHMEAWCTYFSADGRRFICRTPLTKSELDAYDQHPSTFFGVIDRSAGRRTANTAIDLFNLHWETVRHTPKATLLDHLRGAADLDELAKLSQQDLATNYCLRAVQGMLRGITAPYRSSSDPQNGKDH